MQKIARMKFCLGIPVNVGTQSKSGRKFKFVNRIRKEESYSQNRIQKRWRKDKEDEQQQKL